MQLNCDRASGYHWGVVASVAQDMQIKVAIVDDDEGIRTSLAALIRRAPELQTRRRLRRMPRRR